MRPVVYGFQPLSIGEDIDAIISESVIEHVDDLENIYKAFDRWLSGDGVMSHLIDYSSHKLSDYWNGDWACPDQLWKIVLGKRHYLINRDPRQAHLELLRSNGLKVIDSGRLRRVDGLMPDESSRDFPA